MKNPEIISEDDLTSWKTKRNITFLIFIFEALMIGVDYTIIIPTLRPYLIQLNASNPEVFYGVSFGCSTFMASAVSLAAGRIADRTRRIKIAITCINSMVILGNICHTVGISPYLIVFGRLLTGTGYAVNPVLTGEISRCYKPQELTRIFTIWSFAAGLGTATGPALNLVLPYVNFWIADFHVTFVNAGTFCVGIIFILIQGVILTCASDLSREYDLKEMLELQREEVEEPVVNEHGDIKASDSQNGIEGKEKSVTDRTKSVTKFEPFRVLKLCLGNETVLIMFATTFLFGVIFMSLEVTPVLIASKVLKWNNIDISFLGVGHSFLFLIFCFIIWKIQHRITSIEMLYVAFFFNAVACFFMIGIGFGEQVKPTALSLVICLVVTLALLLLIEKYQCAS